MNKMNKKGFTLIEMLVVIAIIAVLVSIIIPTVTSATDKAAAAANAANLRSVKAEAVTAFLTNDKTYYTWEGDTPTAITWNENASAQNIAWKEYKGEAAGKTSAALTISVSGRVITATYNGLTIQQWANLAEGKPTGAATE